MKKLLMILLPLILITVGCEKSEDSVICGTWKSSTMTSDTYLTFNSDGTFVWDSTSAGKDYREGRGDYSYNDNQQTLTLSYSDKNRTDLYFVQSLTSSMLVWIDTDGNTSTFRKQ